MRYLLPSLLLAAPSLLAQRFPEVEPNDTSATAQVVTMGTQIDCVLVAAEQDWFQFTTAGGQVRMFVTPTPGTVALDTQLELWDAAGTVILAFNDDSRVSASDLTINLAAGTYLVKIDGFSATTAGNYAFEIGELPAKPYTAVEVEPNDTVATPQLVALDCQINGNLSGPTDQDWYQITLTAPRTGLWIQTTEGELPLLSQHRVEFYDAAGVLVPAATLGTNGAESGSFNYRTSNIRCWPAGTYHIVVKNRLAVPTINPNPVGNYRLEIATMPMNLGAVVPEIAEPNNTFATATPINLGDKGTGNITISTGADSSDWWGPITLNVPSVVMFQTGQNLPSPLLDSSINLRNYDPVTNTLGAATAVTSGNILDASSHARGTFAFNLTPGSYYLEVFSPGTAASQAGDYVLEISQSVGNPYAAASYAFANTANTTCLGSNLLRPTITQETTRELPVLGTSFFRKVGSMQPGAAFFMIQGFALYGNSIIASAGFDLGPLGAPNCLVYVRPDFTTLYIANGVGEAELLFSVPNNLALRGLPLFEQAAVLDLPANALGITASNWARQILGERSY